MAKAQDLPAHIQALRRRSAYPHRPARVELVQTHISYVFLLDDEVYKVKKAVDLGFVDFTTLAKRKQACEAEVRLNRRGSPEGVYHGVEAVRRGRDGQFRIGGEGETVDYAVHMKRLPEDRMMDRMLERGEVGFEMIGRVAGRVAELHATAETSAEITRIGEQAVAANWSETLEQIRAFAGNTLSRMRLQRIERFARSFLERESGLMQRRAREGRVRDCHGDMRSDSICFDEALPGGLCIYDCIEFNDAFRYCDTALDVAFLAMDLDYRGHADLADLFIGLYAAAAGDPELGLLLNFHKSYRACVRGKVDSLLSIDKGVSARQRSRAAQRARAYFRLAEAYAARVTPSALLLITGPSGSGKSVLAGVLAARLGAVLLSTDMLRRELFDAGGLNAPLGAGIYDDASRSKVYAEMLRRFTALTAQRRNIVLDGTFVEKSQRAPYLRAADEAARPLFVVECTAPEQVIRERQQRRRAQPWTVSDGRMEVYLAQKQHLEPADEVPPARRLKIDTTRPLAEQIAVVEARLV
jgi:aminoglycoside phosphotransferase family enzyme/predicted kinase